MSAAYIIACLTIPAVWGLLASWVYDSIAARRAKYQPEESAGGEESADMYHI